MRILGLALAGILFVLPFASAEAEEITPIAEAVRGTVVVLSGTVDRLKDEDELVLADETGRIDIYTGGPYFGVSPGDRIVVRGWVDDDLLGREVYAQEIVTATGDVHRLRTGY